MNVISAMIFIATWCNAPGLANTNATINTCRTTLISCLETKKAFQNDMSVRGTDILSCAKATKL